MEDRLKHILEVANRIMPWYQSRSDKLIKFILGDLKKRQVVFAYNSIACDGNIFMIVADDPKKLIAQIMQTIQDAHSKEFQDTLNPVSVITKLSESEFMVDMNGTHMMYVVKASVPSNNVLKSIACKCAADVRNYYDITKLDELHPDFNYSKKAIEEIEGGKKNKNKKSVKPKRTNPRMDALADLIKLINDDAEIAKGIILVDSIEDCAYNAMNIIYIDRKYKDAITNRMQALYTGSVRYKFKAFMHNDFHVPYNFKLTKHSCLVSDGNTGQSTYIANLYNLGGFMPIPTYKSPREKNIIMAHPMIRLQLLYIDLFIVEHKTKTADPKNYKAVYYNRLMSAYDKTISFDKEVEWVGYYMDDAQNRIKFNMMSRVNNNNDQYYI